MGTRKHRRRDVIELQRAVDEKTSAIFSELLAPAQGSVKRLAVPEVTTKIAEAFQAQHSFEVARDIGFHVSDWNWDAAFVVALHLFPERFTNEEVAEGVINMLIHAPNHLAAAAKLAGYPIEDIFGVGALDGPESE